MQALQAEGLSVAGMKPVASGSEWTSTGLRNGDAMQPLSQSPSSLNTGGSIHTLCPGYRASSCGTEKRQEIDIG